MCDDFFEDFDGIDWEDWAIIGGLSEELAREKRERDRIIRDNDTSEDDYWDIINDPW